MGTTQLIDLLQIQGSGVNTQILFSDGTSANANANLTWDTGNNALQIGGAANGSTIGIGSGRAVFVLQGGGSQKDGVLILQNTTGFVGGYLYGSNTEMRVVGQVGGKLTLWAGAAERMNISPTGASITGYGPVATTLVDMTPDSANFTGTLTGCTTSPTANVVCRRMGNFAVLTVAALTGTSNTTSMSMTGLPAAWQPAFDQAMPCNVEDNGSNSPGMARVQPGLGTISFFRSVVTGAANVVTFGSTGFTNSGVKGLNITVIGPYILA